MFSGTQRREGAEFSFFLNTDSTDQRDYVACTRDWNLYNPENLWLFFPEHRKHEKNGIYKDKQQVAF